MSTLWLWLRVSIAFNAKLHLIIQIFFGVNDIILYPKSMVSKPTMLCIILSLGFGAT